MKQGYLARDNLQIKFSTLIRGRQGAAFFPITTINLLSLKRIRDSDFKNNFVIMKRERDKIQKISMQSFSLRDIPVTC